MKSLGRTLVAVGAAAALCIGVPVNAQAAEGTFTYISNNQEHTLENPENDRCYDLGRGVTELYNDTDTEVAVFLGAGCQDGVETVGAGGSSTGGGIGSVSFPDDAE
ncbi:hypothetical protein ACIPLC_31545 [Kitasatospora sp. NPDC086801]|uniref:hypothetical protein n=1 Tax=Kitasatospora sp. NPDC086801 TaxID=3364066 RepID=UPI0038019CD7